MAFTHHKDGLTQAAMGGVCYGCGDRHRKGVSAFAAPAFEDFLGQVEVCARCIAEMADQLGFVPPAKHKQVKDTNKRLSDDKIGLVEEVRLLKEALGTKDYLHEQEVKRLNEKIVKAKAGAQ